MELTDDIAAALATPTERHQGRQVVVRSAGRRVIQPLHETEERAAGFMHVHGQERWLKSATSHEF
jgi:hypothetical protein